MKNFNVLLRVFAVATILSLPVFACDDPTVPIGELGGRCNKDGTCNFDSLRCNGLEVCDTRYVSQEQHETETFCKTCASDCGSLGMKSCSYSDPTVWGSLPSTCECK